MNKKILLILVIAMLSMCLFAISISATTVTDSDDDKMTLGQCTIANLDGVTIPSPTVGLVYLLDDKSMTATVSGKGSFSGGELVFPSTVKYDGKTYDVTTINSGLFQNLTYDLYIPDSITFIAGGSRVGTFGNSTIGYVYIGSGLTSFERETFSGSKGFKSFICKSKPTKIDMYAFNQNSAASDFSGFELDLTHVVRIEESAFAGASFLNRGTIEFGDCLEYVGYNGFVESWANGSVIVPANCELSNRCFNGTSFEFVCIRVTKGETRELPQELFSGAHGPMTVVIDGNATTTMPHTLSGNEMHIYMPSFEQIQTLTTAIGKQSNNGRLTKATFYSCEDGHKYKSSSDGTLTDDGEVEGHCYTANTVTFPANCMEGEKEVYICYTCGYEKIDRKSDVLGDHVFRVSIKMPSCQSAGYYEYLCSVCGHTESAHIAGMVSHNASNVSYTLKNSQTLTATKYCVDCGAFVSSEDISLVNKCYIEGYGLFDATLEYVSVSADGVATPKDGAIFENADIYFPSCVMIDENVVEVKTVSGFKAKSIKSIYIPDSVTRIAGGGGVGCFGDIYTLENIVVGKGVTAIEQETFCMGNSVYVNQFIFKGTITRLENLCLSNLNATSADIPYEFNTNLSYVGQKVNLDGNIIREARIAKGCDLSQKFAFNNANGLLTVYIEGGDTPETALDLGQEFTSNLCTRIYYIKGYVKVTGQAVFAGQNNTRVYMSNVKAIDYFTASIKQYSFSNRMNSAAFYACDDETVWYVANDADRIAHPSLSFAHGGTVNEIEASCTQGGAIVESCFVCGDVVSTTPTTEPTHNFNNGIITEMPTQDKAGRIVYTCLTCGEIEEKEIYKLSSTHESIVDIIYANGYAQSGIANTKCSHCDFQASEELMPLIIDLGYSLKDDNTGIVCGYKTNLEVLDYCRANMNDMKFGFLIANAQDVSQHGLFDSEFNKNQAIRGFFVDLTDTTFAYLDVSVVGAKTDAMKNADFIIAVYVVSDSDGDGSIDATFVQTSMKGGNNKPIIYGDTVLNTISINRAKEDSPVE